MKGRAIVDKCISLDSRACKNQEGETSSASHAGTNVSHFRIDSIREGLQRIMCLDS